MLRLWGKTDRCQSAFLTCDEPLLICSAMHEDAQFRVQRLMHETGTPRDRCRCLVGILAGMRRWWTEGLEDRSTKGPELARNMGLLGWLARAEWEVELVAKCEMMRCAKGRKKEEKER